MNVSHLSNELLEEDQLSRSLDTVLHKLTNLDIICLILLFLMLILFAPGENTGHSGLMCSAIQCIKLTPQCKG